MKNLFKILLVVITMVTFTSCNEDIERVSNPMELTTMAAQQASKDTVLLYHDSDTEIIIMDIEKNSVQYELYGVNHNNGLFWFGFFVGMMIAGFLFLIGTDWD